MPTMTLATLPRVLTYSIFLASSFPLLEYRSQDYFGVRFGLIVLLGTSAFYALGLMLFGYIKIIQKKLLDWSEFILGGFSNIISPCMIQRQNSNLITYGSIFAIAHYTILLTTLTITLQSNNPLFWNSEYSKHFINTNQTAGNV